MQKIEEDNVRREAMKACVETIKHFDGLVDTNEYNDGVVVEALLNIGANAIGRALALVEYDTDSSFEAEIYKGSTLAAIEKMRSHYLTQLKEDNKEETPVES